MKLAGADGYKKQWIVYFETDYQWWELHSSITSLFAKHPDITCLAIDMVIGLPKVAHKGGRAADKAARKKLGRRGSCVFSAPCRSAVYATDYQTALQLSRHSSPDRIGISKQTFNIFPMIRQLDQFLRHHPQYCERIHEVHPELSFWHMNQQKNLPSKHHKEGHKLRLKLLQEQLFLTPPKQKLQTDHLDAAACLWSSRRISKQQGDLIPKDWKKDGFGLPMRIEW